MIYTKMVRLIFKISIQSGYKEFNFLVKNWEYELSFRLELKIRSCNRVRWRNSRVGSVEKRTLVCVVCWRGGAELRAVIFTRDVIAVAEISTFCSFNRNQLVNRLWTNLKIQVASNSLKGNQSEKVRLNYEKIRNFIWWRHICRGFCVA